VSADGVGIHRDRSVVQASMLALTHKQKDAIAHPLPVKHGMSATCKHAKIEKRENTYQVPVFNRPFVIGIETLVPIKDVLVWLTESSGPTHPKSIRRHIEASEHANLRRHGPREVFQERPGRLDQPACSFMTSRTREHTWSNAMSISLRTLLVQSRQQHDAEQY
jgi:hypothetical protein